MKRYPWTFEQHMKKCNRCGVIKNKKEFTKQKNGNPVSRCRVCLAEVSKKRRDSRSEERKTEDKFKQRLRDHNVTKEGYKSLYDTQEGKCGICGTCMEYLGTSACIDHCHETGKVRGLLCQHCNKALGGFKDSRENLRKAIEYLDKTGTGS